jgi:hypothetical protein
VTVKFRSAQLAPEQMGRRLVEAVQHLVQSGAINSGRVEAVFEGELDPDLSTLFTIDFVGSAEPLLSKLNNLQGVEYAHVAPERRALWG